jgi:hypothetical protein
MLAIAASKSFAALQASNGPYRIFKTGKVLHYIYNATEYMAVLLIVCFDCSGTLNVKRNFSPHDSIWTLTNGDINQVVQDYNFLLSR